MTKLLHFKTTEDLTKYISEINIWTVKLNRSKRIAPQVRHHIWGGRIYSMRFMRFLLQECLSYIFNCNHAVMKEMIVIIGKLDR